MIEKQNYRIILNLDFTFKCIISYGLIVYNLENCRWLLTQRKHSVEFLIYCSGDYRISGVPVLLMNMTSSEINEIKKCFQDPEYFQELYSSLQLDTADYLYALERLKDSKEIVLEYTNNHQINNELRWTWPKGRVDYDNQNETGWECACREFFEEVGVRLPEYELISNHPVIENFKTLDGKIIESRYWIVIIRNQFELPADVSSNCEVCDRRWVTTSEVTQLLKDHKLFNEVVKFTIDLEKT